MALTKRYVASDGRVLRAQERNGRSHDCVARQSGETLIAAAEDVIRGGEKAHGSVPTLSPLISTSSRLMQATWSFDRGERETPYNR